MSLTTMMISSLDLSLVFPRLCLLPPSRAVVVDQNNLMELWSLLHFLMPYVFRSRKEFSYWFHNPLNDIIEGDVTSSSVVSSASSDLTTTATANGADGLNTKKMVLSGGVGRNDDLIHRLHGIIRPFVLRRLKRDVETQLPGKYEHVITCPMSRRQVSQFGVCVDMEGFVLMFVVVCV